MAGGAVRLAVEEREAALLGGAQRAVLAPHVAVEGRVGLHQGPLEGRDRHVGMADVGPVVAEHVAEALAVLGHEGEPRLHHVVLAIAGDGTARRRARLRLQ